MVNGRQHLLLRCAHTFACCWILVWSFALLGVSLAVEHKLSPYKDFLHYYETVVTSCIIFGAPISIAIALWGCIVGHKNVQHLTAFAIVLGSVLGAHVVALLVHNFYAKTLFERTAETVFGNAMKNHGNNSEAIDFVQTNLECCGWNNASDWFNYGLYIPLSCCPYHQLGAFVCEDIDFFTMHHDGCSNKLLDLPKQSDTIISILFVLLQVAQISSLLLSCWICWCVLNDVYKQTLKIANTRTHENC